MKDKEYLNMALAKMHSGQWFGWKKDYTGTERMSYENIEVLDSSITKPTEAEVNAKIQEWIADGGTVIDNGGGE